ncbi:hypothetical protein GW932_01945 [archaeon]|nr:hypothetical protein [archaeon]
MARRKDLNYDEVIEKIMEKKEFRKLPLSDVKLVYSQFEDREDLILDEKIKETRDLLRKMYTAFVSEKLLNVKDKEPIWFLQKHISTKERLNHYIDVYKKCLDGLDEVHHEELIEPNYISAKDKLTKGGIINVYDLGSGINGFSYDYFLEAGFNVNYFGFEAVGQLVDLQNNYFLKEKKNADCFHGSLFDLEIVKSFLKKGKGKKVVFLFKTLDSLEMLKRNYSKELLKEIMPFVDRVVVSWATKSLVSKKNFYAERKWLKDFIKENYKIIDEFQEGIENYLIFENK